MKSLNPRETGNFVAQNSCFMTIDPQMIKQLAKQVSLFGILFETGLKLLSLNPVILI